MTIFAAKNQIDIMLQLFILQAGGASSIASFAPMLIVLAIIYFFFLRPQQKRQAEQRSFADTLEKGMEVVTSSGIIGKINKLEAKEVTLQVDAKSFIRVTRGAISKEMTEAFAAKEEKKS